MAQLENAPKPKVVFIPGTLCTSAMFQSFCGQQDYEVIVIDFEQQSTIAAMCHLLKTQIGDDPIILAGFSMGGMVAFEFIRQFPDQVLGLILLNSNSHSDLAGRKASRDEHLELAKLHGLEYVLREIYLPIYFPNQNPIAANCVIDMANDCGIEVFIAQLNVLATRPDSLQTLNQFRRPTLIIGAEHDLPCPPAHQYLMSTSAHQSELHILEGAGHFAPLEKPVAINQIIKLWLEKHYV